MRQTPVAKNGKMPTGNDLWDQYFLVRYNYALSRSAEDIRRYGTRISGLNELDKDLHREMISTEINIDTMFELYRKGVTIYVTNYNDTEKIYRIIHNHLIAWADYMANGIHTGAAPLKDLVELDIFAGIVYDKAKSVFSKQERETGLASFILKSQTLNFANILKRSTVDAGTEFVNGVETTTINKVKSKNPFPERSSFKDVFIDQMVVINAGRENE